MNSSNSGDERRGANSSSILAFFALRWNRWSTHGDPSGYLWGGDLSSTAAAALGVGGHKIRRDP
jgi:hypothetical protein